MADWLGEEVGTDEALVRRLSAAVVSRVERRRRLQRVTAAAGTLCLLSALVGVGASRLQGNRPPAPRTLAAAVPASPADSSGLPITIAKVDESVALSWEGKPEGEFVVYRCDSPRFDSCALVDEVRGTQWLDGDSQSGTITYYRVEPRG